MDMQRHHPPPPRAPSPSLREASQDKPISREHGLFFQEQKPEGSFRYFCFRMQNLCE